MLVELKKQQKKNRRIGHGIGSKKGGHTVGYGQKGQGSRGKGKIKPGFEGGNIPLYRKIPTLKGFNSIAPRKTVITIQWLAANTKAGDVIDLTYLAKSVNTKKGVRVIGIGELKHAITIKGIYVTKGAKSVIEAAGGKIEES